MGCSYTSKSHGAASVPLSHLPMIADLSVIKKTRSQVPHPPISSGYGLEFLLLQGFSLDAERTALIAAARELGIKVCSDCQHIEMDLSAPGMVETLRQIDVFLPNETEAKALTGEQDVEAALKSLARYCPTVVIKCGADGAFASDKGRLYHAPALAVEVFDTTGAGDSFNAGFVYGLLHEPDFASALDVAVICGSLAVTGYGGRNLPFHSDLNQYRRHSAAI